MHFGGQRMVILKEAAINLITRYYPDFFDKIKIKDYGTYR